MSTAIDAKVHMSLDDIIKMDKRTKKKGGPAGGNKKGAKKGPMKKNIGNNRGRNPMKQGGPNQQQQRGQVNNRRGRSRSRVQGVNSAVQGPSQRSRSNTRFGNKRQNQNQNQKQQQQGGFRRAGNPRGGLKRVGGQQTPRRSLSGIRGGFITKKKFNNRPNKIAVQGNKQKMMRMNLNNTNQIRQQNNQNNQNRGIMNQNRGMMNQRARSRSRSRSRVNLMNNKMQQQKPMKRTNSLPNLRNPLSIHNRLGFQTAKQLVYRNRVKKAKQVLLKRQNKKMASPIRRNVAPLMRRAQQQSLMTGNQLKNMGFRSDQILKNQKRMQYQQMQMNARAAQMAFINNQMQYGGMNPNMIMANPQMRQQRGRSPFRQNQMNARRGRSRSRSRSRSRPRNMAMPEQLMHNNSTDRVFSEVMYSLQGNYGITGRTLNDRFSY